MPFHEFTQNEKKSRVAYAASFSARSWTGLFLPSVLIDLLLLQTRLPDWKQSELIACHDKPAKFVEIIMMEKERYAVIYSEVP